MIGRGLQTIFLTQSRPMQHFTLHSDVEAKINKIFQITFKSFLFFGSEWHGKLDNKQPLKIRS